MKGQGNEEGALRDGKGQEGYMKVLGGKGRDDERKKGTWRQGKGHRGVGRDRATREGTLWNGKGQ